MRPLDPVERELLDLILSAEVEGVVDFRLQAEHIANVESDCRCGCPSIALNVDRNSAPSSGIDYMVLPTARERVEQGGVPREVICFVEDGYLSSLECVYYADTQPEWPAASDCFVLVEGGHGNWTGAEWILDRPLTKDGQSAQVLYASAVLPTGPRVRPQAEGDRWRGLTWNGQVLEAETVTGYRETYAPDGALVSRVVSDAPIPRS
jgi:hypothetical protein